MTASVQYRASKLLVDAGGGYIAAAHAPASRDAMTLRVCEEVNPVRPFMTNLLEQLVARHADGKRIDLDDIAEVIGTRVVSYDEVEWLVDRLEAEGFSVGEGIEALDVNVMKDVLAHARALREALGHRPTIDEIAYATGRPVYVVRRALERAAGKHTKAG